MKKYTQILLLTISIFFHSVFFVYPQAYQYQFEQITTSDGLSGNGIYAVIQDSSGFMWIGADPGLNLTEGVYPLFFVLRSSAILMPKAG